MQLLKKLLIAAVALVLLLVIASQFLPANYHVERSIVIAAKPEAIHPWINNVKKWPDWSVWTAAQDSSLVYTYDGSEEGVGAISKWESKKLGQGQMKIVESDAAKGVKFDLSFEHGKYLCTGMFAYAAEGEVTKVTWSTDGKVSHNPVDRFFNFLWMDKAMGRSFEEGLSHLKKQVEAK